MSLFRAFSRQCGSPFLVLLFAALGFYATVPAGYMVTPGAHGSVAIVPCPGSNPLARLMDALPHDASGMNHATMDSATHVHAAMEHGAEEGGRQAPASAKPDSKCAFSALAFAGIFDDPAQLGHPALSDQSGEIGELPRLDLVQTQRWRPPLRAPPALG